MSTTTDTEASEDRAPSIRPAPKAARGDKSAFVMGLPRDLGAKEVVAQAKQQGITISEGYVYMVRGAGKVGAKPTRKGKPARRPMAQGVKGVKAAIAPSFAGLRLASDDPREQALIDAIRAIGVSRARAVIDVIEKFERVAE